jgi:hypothetical protein
MVRITDSAIINRPVAAVWKFVSDPSNNPKWYDGTLEMAKISERPIGVGSTVEAIIQFRGRPLAVGAKCVALNKNQELTWEFISGITKGSTDNWRMESISESKTRLTRVFDMRVSGLARLIQPIVVRGTQRAHEAEISNVKRILETEHLDST